MLPQDQICAMKEQSAQVLKHSRGSRHRPTCERGDHMPYPHEYCDSEKDCKTEQSSNWQSIGELARKLADKAKAGK